MTLGIAGGLIVLGLGVSFLGGVLLVSRKCEVLNEHITKRN